MSGVTVTEVVPPRVPGEDDDGPDDERHVPEPSAKIGDEQIEKVDNSVAAMLRAKRAQLKKRSQKFAVPPYDVWGDDLVIEVVPIKMKTMSHVAFILQSTKRVLIRTAPDAPFAEVEDGWKGVGKLMGLPDTWSIGEIIKTVCGDEDNDKVIPVFVTEILEWAAGRSRQIEDSLGE